jgi:hypothetical protein
MLVRGRFDARQVVLGGVTYPVRLPFFREERRWDAALERPGAMTDQEMETLLSLIAAWLPGAPREAFESLGLSEVISVGFYCCTGLAPGTEEEPAGETLAAATEEPSSPPDESLEPSEGEIPNGISPTTPEPLSGSGPT